MNQVTVNGNFEMLVRQFGGNPLEFCRTDWGAAAAPPRPPPAGKTWVAGSVGRGGAATSLRKDLILEIF